MSGPDTIKLENTEAETQLSADTIESSVVADTNSDNSQSSTSVPPDITQADTYSLNDPYTSDPPDLNPEEDTDLPNKAIKKESEYLTLTTYEAAELSDSSGPPDITSATYEKTEEEEDIEIKDYSYADSNSPAPLLTSLEEQGEFTDFPTELPEDPQNIFPDTDPPPDLLHQEDLTPPEGYLSSSFPESCLSESLLAVAPGDILPVVSLPQANPNFFQQNKSPTLSLNIKRGPGRPRKDGQDPAPRRRSSSKPLAKSIVTKAQRILHNSSGINRKYIPSSEQMDSGSQSSLSQSEITMGPFAMDTGEDTTQYELEEDVSTGICESLDETSLDSQLPVRVCSLCNCGERSLLGQGDIFRFEPTQSFNFRKTLAKNDKKPADFDERSLEKEGTSKPLTWRRNRGPIKGMSEREREKSHSPRRTGNEDDLNLLLGDELTVLGFPEEIEAMHVFESTGHVWAHQRCAAWSEGVSATVDGSLKFVDKAVFNGLSQKCSYCRRYGATINCVYPQCTKKYHYPCAAAGSCFQDKKKLAILCPDHSDQAEAIAGEEAYCVLCCQADKINKQLFCTSCGHHYHGSCLHPSVALSPEVRAGWQCPDCKVCQMCRQPGEDSKMLVCDTCDKGYHTFCLKPVMTAIPKNGWKCKNCRVCGDCGSRTPGSGPSSRWHLNYSVCDSCYQQRNKGLSCPLCGKAYRQFTQKAMIQCNTCKKHVHAECDDIIDNMMLERVKNEEHVDYMCSVCRNRDPEIDTVFPFNFPCHEEPSNEMFDIKDSDMENASSIMDESSSSFLLNEDSISSMDIDINALEKFSSPPHIHPHVEGCGMGSKGGKLNAMSRKKIGVSSSSGRSRGRPMAPEKKKRPSAFCERKRGPKPKMKTQPGLQSQISPALPGEPPKKFPTEEEEDGDDHPQTIILANAQDRYVLDQDVCKSCGSFGQGEEGKLIVCTQCGQCYHPYCAGVKEVTKVILQKGWRCLDCTVCEGCGKPHDEGRLLLCDECDISYHIYCLDPPLDHVPKGTWKCKWCVMCVNCGSTTPGFGCNWQNNYTQCGPCRSKIDCPVCRHKYHEDEMIIQCLQCSRWLHAQCDGLRSEDDMERAAEYEYQCLFCRPKTGKDGPLPPPPPPPTPPPVEIEEPPTPPFYREPEPLPQKRYLMDGVYLSETGVQHMQEITIQIPKVKRQRRTNKRPSIDMLPGQRLITQMSAEGDEDKADGPDDGSELSTPLTAEPRGDGDPLLSPTGQTLPGIPVEGEKKERKRRTTIGLGVGGFIAKPRNRQTNVKRQIPEVSAEVADGQPRPEGTWEDGDPVPLLVEGEMKKQRKRQARKKSQLENSFPNYLQEAFFGKDILDKSKAKVKQGHRADSDSDPESRASTPNLPKDIPQPSLFPEMSQGNSKLPTTLPSVGTSQSVLSSAASIVSSFSGASGDINPIGDVLPDLEELPPDDLLSIFKDGDLPMTEEQPASSQTTAAANSELPDILSDVETTIDVDKMLPDDLTQIDGQTVDDIFNGVLQPEGNPSQAGGPQFPVGGPNVPRLPPHMPPHPGQMPPGMTQLPYGPDYSGVRGEQPSWQQVGTEEEGGGTTTSRRNMLKWECDEDLGEHATISAVLYCNLRHPELKQQYPDWSERVKKIAKAWRELSSDEKQPYLMQARKNRASTKQTQDVKKQKNKAPIMGPPMAPGPQGQMPLPQNSPYPPQGVSDNMGSPVGLSPTNRVPSNPSIMTTPEGHSPGQMPGSLPNSPMSHPTTPQDHRMIGPHGDPFNPVMAPHGIRHPLGGPPRLPMVRTASGGMDPYTQDPYAKPPSTPLSGPQTPQKSPSKLQWPGQAQESDPYENPPATPMEGINPSHVPVPGQPFDPYGPPPHTQRPGMVPPQGVPRPPFSRQASLPATQTTHTEDPYAFPPHTPGPRPTGDVQAPDMGGRQPGDMYSGMGDHLRPPYPSSSVPGSMGQPLQSTAPDIYRMAGQPGMRLPFRPPGPPTSQPLTRPDVYGQPLHPGMEQPREQSALQQMYAAASRRHALFPFSGMFSSIKHPYLGLQDKTSAADTSQQVRTLLHKQAESRMRQVKAAEPPQAPWEGHPPAYTSEEMTRFPVSRGTWPAPPRMPGPRQIPHPTDMESYGMRPPFGEGVHPGQMRQPRPHGPMMPEMYSPKHSPQMSPGQLPSLRPGQNPLAGNDQRSQFPNLMEHRFPVPGQQVPPAQQGVPSIQGQSQTYRTEQSRIPPGNMGEQRKLIEQDQREDGKSAETKEEKKESEEDKHLNEPDIDDLLGSDGTFDIIKFVDTDTELNLDENKSIFDDLDEVENGSMEKADNKEDMKMHVAKEKMDSDMESSKSGGGIPDFQSKFLEFSQKKNEERKIGTEGGGQMSEMDKKDQQNISQIAALLQSSEHMSPALERRDSVKSDSSVSGKDQLPRTPGSGPLTPSGMQQGVDQAGSYPGMGSRGPYAGGMPSPLHQMQNNPTQASPGSTYPPGQGPSTPGLPSPQIMPSPRSNIPSPRTPSVQSPFNPMNNQQSPFPQTQSPFSPTVSSAPQSPYAGSKPQPPFSLPVGSTSQTGYSSVESGAPAQSPGQRSPRGTITPTNQYMQGTYGQPMMQGPPRGTTLTPTPSSILYGGQSGVTQHGIRNPVPVSVNGSRPPFSGASGHPMGHGIETVTSQVHPMDPSAVPHMASSQAPHGSGDMQGHPPSTQSPAAMSPYGLPGQRMPGIRPQMGGLTSPVTTSAPGGQGVGRPQLLQEQPLLIQDLLEQYEEGSTKIKLKQEKQEQQRQAQQQAMGMMQRQPPEGMMAQPPRPGLPMGQYRPRMEGMRHPVDPNWNVQRPYGQPEIPPGQPPFVRMPGQQMPPRMPGPYGAQPPGIGPMGIPQPPPPPPPPPMTGELTPELERQQQQYEDWLLKHGNYLEMQVKALEQQIGKCKRTKKAINARNRQAKKTGREPSPNDATELERVTQEQAGLQKQLEGLRKQVKQHQMQTQDYRTKKRERYGQDWAFSQIPPASGPAIMSIPPGGLQPRIPGQQGSARLTASARQAYDEYMQDRLRQTQQIQAPPVGAPRPKHTVVEDNKTKVAGPKAILQDNNPFSEEYQEREQRERVYSLPKSQPETDKPEIMRQMPQYFDPRTMPYDQSGRFPAPRIPGDSIQRFPGPGQRMPFETSGRMPGPPDSAVRHAFPQRMYTPMNQGQVEGTQGGPHPAMPYQPGFSTPTSEMVTNMESSEKKSKKRKKKKKAAESTTTAPVGASEPRPPVQFTPQSETEKRIMEILNNTAGLTARGPQETMEKSPGKAKAGDALVSNSDQKSGMKKPDPGDGSQVIFSTGASSSSSQPIYSNVIAQSSYQSENTDTEDQQEEPILPMNVMIHQSIPQSAAIACSVQQMQSSVSQGQQSDTAAQMQEPDSNSQASENSSKTVMRNVPADQVNFHDSPRIGGSEVEVAPPSNDNANIVKEPENICTSVQHMPPQMSPLSTMPGHVLPPPNSQERMSPRGMIPPSYVGAYAQFHGRMSPRQAFFGSTPSGTLMPLSQNQTTSRQSSTPSPGRYSPRQSSPSQPGGPSAGRYSPRQGSPGVSRPPSRPSSQPGPGYVPSRQGPTPPIPSGYPNCTPPASPRYVNSPVAIASGEISSRAETSVAQVAANLVSSVPTCYVLSASQTPPADSVAVTPATDLSASTAKHVNVQDRNSVVNVSQHENSASSEMSQATVTEPRAETNTLPDIHSNRDAER
ncbi:histone-lysine N-methyltransferase 2C-like isoform X11 [Ostrea edulis]|uniref:histone-lysine N-methyltransferase 2C-like isoform X11 n=1 Tax=Ostrea edulis TaxID=37623 RepID=UPI0024AECF0E|nr:histone-lysine N-methyltransferase 2C-like isoform X11 [Ostrea edulis]